ncbi:hypothetical protein [Fibrella aquatilis]|uniref:Uncharacterized protein n=1 Tax=Fibrella aquatilis TaxID=2817059 RepID=A0A939G7C6_9BACT|nr:hypothetical protein [Fibrella aquatilis]MBO0931502.1 hypothetical protein [Fibrella aquatilis]
MKSTHKTGTGRHPSVRKARVRRNNAGEGFVVVKSGDNTFILSSEAIKVALPISQTSLFVPASDGQTSFPVYSSREIREAGGIDALSEAIGNSRSIKAPLIEISEKEWEEMTHDLSSDN